MGRPLQEIFSARLKGRLGARAGGSREMHCARLEYLFLPAGPLVAMFTRA